MGKYYYVGIANPLYYKDRNGNLTMTETCKEISNYVTQSSLNYSNYDGVALVGVKGKRIEYTTKGFLGIPKKQSYYEYNPLYIICEDMGDRFQKLITGKNYDKEEKPTAENDDPFIYLKFYAIREIPSNQVIEMLKSIDKCDAQRFRSEMNNLLVAIKNGYYSDYDRRYRQSRDTTNENYSKQLSDDSYIKQLRNRL